MPCSWGFLGLIAREARPSAAAGKVCAAVGMSSHTWCVARFFVSPSPPRWRSVYTAWGTFALLLPGNSATSLYYWEAADGEPKKLPPARPVN